MGGCNESQSECVRVHCYQILEDLEKQAKEIEIDFTNSELMARLAEALKTYCICGGKDDDTFMIQCDDCEDWFHGRCVHVEVRARVCTFRH